MDIFEELPVEDIERIAALLTEEKFAAGETLFTQGDLGDSMYIVTGGRIKLFTVDDSGAERVLTYFGDGDFFGEMALLTGGTRSASAMAEEDSRALVLTKDAFDSYVATNPVVMREMLKVVTRRQTATSKRMVENEEGQGTAAGTGQVFVLFSPRGGSGKTTLAINLAVALAQQDSDRVALLDLDLVFSHAAMMLRLQPQASLADLPPESLRNLDRESLNRYLLTHHSSTLRVFVGANKPEEGEAVTGEHVRAALEVMKRQFLYTIVDTSSNFSEPVLAALEKADKLMVVCTPELNSVRDTRECQRIFSDVVHIPREKLVYVMNQPLPFRVLSNDQFEQALELQLVADIPHAGEQGLKLAIEGRPLYLAGAGAGVIRGYDALAVGLLESATNGAVKGKGRRAAPKPKPAKKKVPPRPRVPAAQKDGSARKPFALAGALHSLVGRLRIGLPKRGAKGA
jgi:CRP-like cAMP-binding protein